MTTAEYHVASRVPRHEFDTSYGVLLVRLPMSNLMFATRMTERTGRSLLWETEQEDQ